MAFLFRSYVKLLQRYTLPTQMVTGGVVSAAGSAIAQHGIEGRALHEHEWFRTRRLAAYGGIIFAPCANRWHALLNMIQFKSKVTTVASRLVVDASFFAPFATTLFYFSQGTFESRPLHSTAEVEGIVDRLNERLWPTVQKQWALFVPLNVASQAFAPVYARPPLLNLGSLVWNVYLAGAQARGAIRPLEDDERVPIADRTKIRVAAVQAME